MHRGILTVGEGMSFDDIDSFLANGLGQDDSGAASDQSSQIVTSLGPEYNPNAAFTETAPLPVMTAPAPVLAPSPAPAQAVQQAAPYLYRAPAPVPQAIAPPVTPSTTQSILTAFNQTLAPAANAYGAYTNLRLAPTAARPMVPMLPRPSMGPTAAPASTGMSPMTLAMIGGGALLFLGFVFVLTRS